MWRTRLRQHRLDRGAYTAELAVAMPALVLLGACCMLGIGYAGASLRCDDATRAGARAVARGEPVAAVEAASKAAAPRQARIQVQRTDEVAEVRCSAQVRLAGLRTFQVRSRSVATLEDAPPAEAPSVEEAP